MEFKKCELCGEYGFSDRHMCPPAWVVILDDDYESAAKYYGKEPESVAIKAATDYDAGEYTMTDDDKELIVAIDRWDTWMDQYHSEQSNEDLEAYVASIPRYRCTAQLVPEYSANLIKQ